MSKIRELKPDMQVIEIKPDTRLASDISEKMGAKEIEQSVMSLVKTQHHHTDGSPVKLEVVHHEEEEFQRKMAREQGKEGQKGLDALVQANMPQQTRQTEDEEQRKIAQRQGGVSTSYKTGAAAGSSPGVEVQCNCGQGFHFGGAQAQQVQTTAEKMDAVKMKYASGGGGGGSNMDATRQQYAGWGGGMAQSYQGGADDDRGTDYRR